MVVIVLGWGGSDFDVNSDLYKIMCFFWEKINYKIVEIFFMGVIVLLIDEGVEWCLKLGVKKVVIFLYFLFIGVLIKWLEEMVK